MLSYMQGRREKKRARGKNKVQLTGPIYKKKLMEREFYH